MTHVSSIAVQGLFGLLFLLSGSLGSSQVSFTRKDVRDLFPAQTKNVWVSQLRGYLGGVHKTDMLLGTDGQSFRGMYAMVQSGETFYLEGFQKEGMLLLAEMNAEQRLSGFLKGQYDGKKFTGQWVNSDKSDSLSLTLSFVGDNRLPWPPPPRASHWHRIYEGTLDGIKRKIYLHRDGDHYNCVHFEGKERHEQQTVGKGSRAEFLSFGFSGCALEGKWIALDTASLEKIDIILPDEDGYSVVSTFREESVLEFVTYEYADYHSRLTCIRPASEDTGFTIWLDEALKSWIDSYIVKMSSRDSLSIGTKDRWVQMAEAWVEVDLFLPQVVSGTIYLQSSLSAKTDKISFIYDVRNEKPVVLTDFFINKESGSLALKDRITEQIALQKWQESEIEWVKNQEFNFLTLCEQGICCRTDFNAIYGEKQVVIPFDDVLPLLKTSALMKAITGK